MLFLKEKKRGKRCDISQTHVLIGEQNDILNKNI